MQNFLRFWFMQTAYGFFQTSHLDSVGRSEQARPHYINNCTDQYQHKGFQYGGKTAPEYDFFDL